MTEVQVKILSPIMVGGAVRKGGQPMLPIQIAKAYAASGSVSIIEAPSAPQPQDPHAEVIAAIAKLDRDNSDHFAQSGKPKVKAVQAELKAQGSEVEVNGELIEAVWAQMQAEA